MTLSIIIPTYNSHAFISASILSVINALQPAFIDYEIIIVDDASTDNTVAILNGFCTQHRNCRLIINKHNSGQQKSTFIGIMAASSDYVATMDDDMEYGPADIIRLYNCILTGNYELVYGIPDKIKKGLINQIIYRAYIFTLKKSNGKRKTSFRIFNRKLANQLSAYSTATPFNLDYILAKLTNHIAYISVNYNPSGTSRYTLWMYLRLLLEHIQMNKKGIEK